MLGSKNIHELGWLQNAKAHGPTRTIKTIEKPILHRTQVPRFCSGNSNQDTNASFQQTISVHIITFSLAPVGGSALPWTVSVRVVPFLILFYLHALSLKWQKSLERTQFYFGCRVAMVRSQLVRTPHFQLFRKAWPWVAQTAWFADCGKEALSWAWFG